MAETPEQKKSSERFLIMKIRERCDKVRYNELRPKLAF